MYAPSYRRGLHELQMKQADRQAKEYAAAKDQQTLEVLKRCIDYLARAGLCIFDTPLSCKPLHDSVNHVCLTKEQC